MEMSRVTGKFCTTPVFGLDQTTGTWVDLGVMASLETYDRFISERSFGQKKRVLVTQRETPIPEEISQIRVGDFLDVFLVESLNPDMAETTYELVYSLRSARYSAVLCQRAGQQRLSGVIIGDVEQELETLWVDLERFGVAESREFDAVDYTIYTVTLPRHSQVKPGQYLKVGTQRYKVEEVYPQLDLPTAKVTRYV